MNIAKAVITAAGPTQRTLPMQTVIDRDGGEKSVLRIIVEEVLRTGVEEICLVVCPGDEQAYTAAVGDHAGRLHFVQQKEPGGYGQALHCAHQFVGDPMATKGRRYDVGVKYGLLTAQLALGLDGVDRDQVLTDLLELLALRELGAAGPCQDL